MKTLYRYVLRELMTPTLMGLSLFTFLLLMNYLLQLADMIIDKGVSVTDVGRLFMYSVPHTIVLTVPMAVLLGGLIAFGRMSADSEVVAIRTGGISLYHLAVPALVLAGGAWILNSYLMLVVLPWGNNQLRQLQWQLVTNRTISSEIKPRIIYDDFPNFILYIEDVTDGGQVWNDVFLAKTDEAPPMVVLAERGWPIFDEENRVFWLRLANGVQYKGGTTAQEATVTSFGQLDQVLLDESDIGDAGPVHKDDRSMNLDELFEQISLRESEGQPAESYWVEVHKRFAFPVACLVLGLLALPLGISTTRHTKTTGFVLAILVIAVYYQFIENGEKFAEEGAIPAWLGMWSANLVLAPIAIFLLWSKTREIDWGIADAFGRVVDWIRYFLRKILGRVTSSTADAAPARARRQTRGFPRLIDRYIVGQFWRHCALALAAFVTMWLVAEYSEISDDVFAANAGFGSAFQYLKFQIPFILSMVLPIATLMAILTTYSLMSKSSEVIAALSGGISLYRLALPILLPAILLTVANYALQDYIVPSTNRRAAEIRDSWREDNRAQSYRPAGGTWVFGQQSRVFNYADYDQEAGTFQGLHVFYLAEDDSRLTRVEYAERATREDDHWVAHNGWRRHYLVGSTDTVPTQALEEFILLPLPFPEGPDYFSAERRGPEQMPAVELSGYIAEMETQGFDAHRYRVDLHQKLAFPSVVLVLALVGIPFGFRMGRQGTLSGIGIALALAMVFWTLFVFFRALGYAEVLPPLLAAWTPHLLFLALGGYLTLGLRS
jgi:LPS export ABC transporter permease LptF/LPS export ABC transporter permease LptG